MNSTRSSSSNMPLGCALFVLAAIVCLVLWDPVTGWITAGRNNYVSTIYVGSKDDQSTGKGHQYIIFTPQGVFKDTDSFFANKHNSSDLFNKLQTHHWYRCHIHGERQHWQSNYPNLMSCKEVHPAQNGPTTQAFYTHTGIVHHAVKFARDVLIIVGIAGFVVGSSLTAIIAGFVGHYRRKRIRELEAELDKRKWTP